MHSNEPKMAKKWEKEEKPKKESKVKSLIKKMVREIMDEGKLAEQISSFHTIQRNLIDFGFGNMVVSWRGTKKKVKDFKPGNRIDNITLEKTHNTLLKNKSMRYDGNDYKVTPQGKKYFKGTLQLEGKLTEGGKEIAKTILQQLGGNKFIAMTGAKNLGFTDKGIQMKIGRNAKGVTHVIIDLDRGKDLYNIEFVKIRGMKRTTVKKLKGIYADQLKKLFTKYTGLRVSL